MQNSPTEHPDRRLAAQAMIAAAIVALPALALDTCGAINLRDHGGVAKDVDVPGLSDRTRLSSGTRVRVVAELRRDTLRQTVRGNALVALVGSPDVIVFCAATQAACRPSVSGANAIVGQIEDAADAVVGGAALDSFARNVLHVDRAHARILNLRLDANETGDAIRAWVALVLGGLLTLAVLAMMLRARFLYRRANASDTRRTLPTAGA